jgi:DNA-binding NtrC family response regulator
MTKENLNILLVDDEIDLIEIYEYTIKRKYKNAKIYKSFDGEEALNIIKANQIDILLTDQTMPKLDGISLIKKVLELDMKLVPPLILLSSGQVNIRFDLENCLKEKIKMLDKPFDEEDLFTLIEKSFPAL